MTATRRAARRRRPQPRRSSPAGRRRAAGLLPVRQRRRRHGPGVPLRAGRRRASSSSSPTRPTRTSFGYFFAAPGDTFSSGWNADRRRLRRAVPRLDLRPRSLARRRHGVVRPDLEHPAQRHAADPRRPRRRRWRSAPACSTSAARARCSWARSSPATSAFAWSCRRCSTCSSRSLAGILGGALWGGLAGWLKARTGAHEVIITIMLNYVALYLSPTCSASKGFQAPGSNQAISPPMHGIGAAAPPVRRRPPGAPRLADRAARGRRRLVAADPLHARLLAPGGRREPVRRPHGGHGRRAQLPRRHAASPARWPGWPA